MERVYRRQKVVDRIIIGVLAVATAAGLMSVLPGSTQSTVRRTVCRIASLGLGACGQQAWTAAATPLGSPRCLDLARLDQVLPEVSATTATLPDGLTARMLRSRSGDITLDLGTSDGPPPAILDGEQRGTRQLLPGVAIPRHVEWWQPGGQGADSVLAAIGEQHRLHAQRSSALALFAAVGDNGSHPIPDPTISYSSVALDRSALPGSDPAPTSTGDENRLRIDPSSPAVIAHNRILEQTSLVARLTGELSGEPITGTLRSTRDVTGRLTQILFAFSSTQAPETLPGQAFQGASISYVTVPVNTESERALAEAWLNSPTGFGVDLPVLLGTATASADDQLASWLSRAASVTTLTYTGETAATLADRGQQQLTSLRRAEQSDRLRAVIVVPAQPDGSRRQATTDRHCVAS
ncbi:hypothetical protein FOE78_12520 [Microlunatus elymi]|uniref:Uncharacterized protein n=1 Tax=Microlunatus elymi TaxID=2596828 RepID=A0A516PZL3_9ACTN|nr:hypothetical protein [Microlunatus elymi]QDP96626.1 hypothetical protein FOE78_12520 [Microlunatus elymi]